MREESGDTKLNISINFNKYVNIYDYRNAHIFVIYWLSFICDF